MCITSKESSLAFATLICISMLLYIRNNKYDRIIAVLFIVISMIQFIELLKKLVKKKTQELYSLLDGTGTAIDKNTLVSFYVNSEEADSSIFEPPSHSKMINVQGIRLDSLVKEKVKLLKIDAEGGELEVLIGCENILGLITYITIDCGFEKGKNKESTLIACLGFLQKHGFELLEVGQNFRFLFKNSRLGIS